MASRNRPTTDKLSIASQHSPSLLGEMPSQDSPTIPIAPQPSVEVSKALLAVGQDGSITPLGDLVEKMIGTSVVITGRLKSRSIQDIGQVSITLMHEISTVECMMERESEESDKTKLIKILPLDSIVEVTGVVSEKFSREERQEGVSFFSSQLSICTYKKFSNCLTYF